MLSVCVFTGLVYGSASAFSAARNPGDDLMLSVNTRTNPDYDPQGIKLGDMTISPFVSAGTTYTDNVYASDEDEVDDFIHILRSGIKVSSDFIRHSIAFNISGERGLYHSESSENYTDYRADFTGRLDITGQSSIPLMVSYMRDHYDRNEDDDLQGAEPTEFDLWTASTGLIHKGHRFIAKVLGTVRDYAFIDQDLAGGGTLNNSDRDRTEWSLYSSIGLPEEGYFAPFVYSEILDVNYDSAIDGNGYKRDSKGYEVGVGSIVNFSEVTRASFNVGYKSRNADDPRFDDFGSLAYGANIVWEPSTLAAFMLSGKQTIEETLRPDSPGSVVNSVGLSVNYEAFPNLFFKPLVDYQTRDYEGINREIERLSGGIDVTYKMNRNLWLSGAYRYITQEESGDIPNQDDFESNTFNLTLKLQF